MLELLLGYLYSAFDKNPYPGLALRVTHPDGFAWEVSDRALTASTEAAAQLGFIDLTAVNVAQLANELTALGCAVIYQNPAYQSRSADTLLNGAAVQSQTNGDHLFVYDSLVYALVDIYARHLETASFDVMAAVAECYFDKADGEYLDEWGSYFAIQRNPGEVDSAYFARIIAETLRPRNNAIAIENAIKSLTGSSVTIFEPWQDLFRLSVSSMDEIYHIEDGVFWQYGVIQPQAMPGVDWTAVLAVVNRNRSAGVIVADPAILIPQSSAAYPWSDAAASRSRTDDRASIPQGLRFGMLDYMVLGDDEVMLQPSSNAYQLRSGIVSSGLSAPFLVAPPIEVAKAAICLSDAPLSGDVNFIFGAGAAYWQILGDELSGTDVDAGYVLSDLVAEFVRAPIDEIIDQRNMRLVVAGISPVAMPAQDWIRYGAASQLASVFSVVDQAASPTSAAYPFALASAVSRSPSNLMVSVASASVSASRSMTGARSVFISRASNLPFWIGQWDGRQWEYPVGSFKISTW